MVSYLSNDSRDSLLKLVDYVKNSDEYLECIRLKEEISKDVELTKLINEVKKLQKKYIRSGYIDSVKEELDSLNDKLNNYELFIKYNYYLDKVNNNIDIIKSELNNYFEKITDYDY